MICLSQDDIKDINNIALDIKKFCDILNKDLTNTEIIAEIEDCSLTIMQIIKEANNVS